MVHALLSLPYPPAGDGFWSPVTATLNWCEEDYYATVSLAEIINTLTSLSFVYLAIKGIWNCRQNSHDVAWQVAYFNMLLIGIGTVLYHMTLNYWMQLLDELSMIYLTSTSFYALFSYGQSWVVKTLILLFTASFSLFVTLYYYYLNDPIFHQNAFAVLAATVIFTGVYQTETLLRPSERPRTSWPSETTEEGGQEKSVDTAHDALVGGMRCSIGWLGLLTLESGQHVLLRPTPLETGCRITVGDSARGSWVVASVHRSRHLLQPGVVHLVEVLPERPARRCASPLAFTFHVAPVALPEEQYPHTYNDSNNREKWDQKYVM